MTTGAWRLLETYDVSPADAMGLDEALLRSVGAGESPAPTLRLYSWKPDAISLGYFQAFEDVPAARDHPLVVRRLTGGGAIHHHAGELTFSIVLDAKDPAYAGSVPASYERTHLAVMQALERVGVQDPCMRREAPCASDVEHTGMCFHESTSQDICWGSADDPRLRKGVGTAQRRTGGRILHHGSIKVSSSPLEPWVATGRTWSPNLDLATLAEALKAAVQAEFQVDLQEDAVTVEEWQQAADFGQRYVDPAFVHRTIRRNRRG